MLLAAASTGFVASAGLIIAIGAQNAFVLRQGLQRRHVGLVVATCALGDIALILCGVAGIGALVRQWPELLQALRFGGATFLAVYGLMAARRACRHMPMRLVLARVPVPVHAEDAQAAVALFDDSVHLIYRGGSPATCFGPPTAAAVNAILAVS
jgi:arginine exporter protein ArgO